MAAESLLASLVIKLGEMATTESQLQLGIGNDIKFIQDEFARMKVFLRKTQKIRGMEEDISEWVSQMRAESFKVEDVLEDFLLRMKTMRSKKPKSLLDIRACISYVPCFFNQLKLQHKFHSQVEEIKNEIEDISNRKDRYKFPEGLVLDLDEEDLTIKAHSSISAPFAEESDILGIEKHVETLQQLVLKIENHQLDHNVISIVGMGGIGKTTLAKKVYHAVRSEFQCHAWVTVSQTFQVKAILERILEEFSKSKLGAPPNGIEKKSEDSLRENIHGFLQEQRYVLVLDDIWDLNAWDEISMALPLHRGSKVIFTTRSENVAAPLNVNYYVHKLELLPDDVARELFCRKAFGRNTSAPYSLNEYVDGLVRKCGGLPLALVTLGGLMSRYGRIASEWKKVLDNLDWEVNHNKHLGRLKSVLLTSYKYLPSYLKSCFLYCAMFPEDCEIGKIDLTNMWIAEGFVIHQEQYQNEKTLEDIAGDYLKELVERNLLQGIIQRYTMGEIARCRVHDIVREVAIHLLEKEQFGVIIAKKHKLLIRARKERRIAIHPKVKVHELSSTPNNNLGEQNVLHSLHVFENGDDGKFPYSFSFHKALRGLRLLRVLNLKFVSSMPNLPESVGDLLHLRYLALGRMIGGDQCLPSSLGKLCNLQTLDLRWSNITHIPFQLTSLQRLRYFSGPYQSPIEIPSGIERLNQLQALVFVKLMCVDVLKELSNLTQLKILGITEVKGDDYSETLGWCLKQLQQLRTLDISCSSHNEKLQLDVLSPSFPYLEVLNLSEVEGDEFPRWIASQPCLRELFLEGCNFKEKLDPLALLGSSPSLVSLHIEKNGGSNLCFSSKEGAYPNLQHLSISGMPELEQMGQIEEGTLRSLQDLCIQDCPSLKKLPEGIQHLTTLRQLDLVWMPIAFIEMYEEGGEYDWMVKHIPNRNFVPM